MLASRRIGGKVLKRCATRTSISGLIDAFSGNGLLTSSSLIADSTPFNNRWRRTTMCFSTDAAVTTESTMAMESAESLQNDEEHEGPEGDLFHAEIGPSLVGKTASIRRTFDSQANAIGLLSCGGETLAKHASFDPKYDRARYWIRHHAVGQASLSPVMISGLVGALVEASVPQSIPMSCSMKQVRPLIVGVEVEAKIEVMAVYDGVESEQESESPASSHSDLTGNNAPLMGDEYDDSKGFQVRLKTQVARVRDGAVIAEGKHSIWIPDYLHF